MSGDLFPTEGRLGTERNSYSAATHNVLDNSTTF